MARKLLKNIIYLYAGPGTRPVCLDQTEQMFQQYLANYYRVERIQPEDVIDKPWQTKAACFVMPGGRDIPYEQSLNPVGICKIREYVQQGGAYLGICAGAYFASKKIEFALGSEIEVNQERSLKFYDGIASGPVLADYEYHSQKGARAAKIGCEGMSVMVYFNGGCTFLDAQKLPNLDVLGYYVLEDQAELPAIVHIKQGTGCAILSGVHFEFEPSTMDKDDPHLSPVILEIQNTSSQRLILVKRLLNLLNLEVYHESYQA
jgi:biotin--protein ligase